MRRKAILLQRFLTKVRKTNHCWHWTAYKDQCGYGRIGMHGTNRKAHRVAYELFVGKIPKEKYVLHTCDNPGCVNPKHLYVGTQFDNMSDMYKRGRGCKCKGEKHSKATISDELRAWALRAIEFDDYTRSEIAEMLGVSYSCVYHWISHGVRS